MPYQRGPRDMTSRVIFLATWLSLAMGLLIPFAVFLLSDDFDGLAIAAAVLIAAVALLLEIRRRRAVWERWQLQQRRGNRTQGRARSDRRIKISEPMLHPWWQVLGTSEQAAEDEIKAAYYAKMKQFHPDTVAGLAKEFRELAEGKTKEINQAYRQACQSRRSKSPREPQEKQTSG
jgi:DnaJ domain